MKRHSLYIFIILAFVTTFQVSAQRDNRHHRNVVTVANSDRPLYSQRALI